MASPIAFALGPNFDLQAVVGQLGHTFQLRGYTIRSYPLGAGACLELNRHMGGLNTVIGRCEGIKVNFMPGANMLNVSFSDEQWTDKVIGFVVGWFTCWIPWVFTGIGLYNQIQLPKQVENELRIILGTVGVPQTTYYTGPAPTQTYSYYQTPSYPTQPSVTPPAPSAEPPKAPKADPSASAQPFAQDAPPVSSPFPPADPFGSGSPFAASPPAPQAPKTPETPSAPAAPSPPPVSVPPRKKVCPSCGKVIDADCNFCTNCGVKQ